MPDRGRGDDAATAVPSRPLRRTPCVGVCSTTYGDLVCRGCKRYAHEIVGWNAYSDDQRERVWTRLNALLKDSVRAHIDVVDEGKLRAVATRLKLHDAAELPPEVLAFRTLRARSVPLDALGLHPRNARHSSIDTARAIDTEFYVRSRAHYEASFKTLT
ncbi:MAG: DUF1289 domain-containing protein [Gammaproteobacteria bacterium]|nr:DUF1289 domain-containing protein [Gammaproteobacteria bacterium]MDE0179201.1 DUF1289 domain-containing protein [Gammaproteobacteria bacterium]MDE0443058.1 DUF1289 domain-containing protein [Gammaproteobacteria bacterium]